MKKLSKYVTFNWEGFANQKAFLVTGVRPWTDHETGALCGTKIDVVIIKDDTDYGASKEGEKVTNLFEKLTIKVPSKISVPISSQIEVINATAVVYGNYHDQLSVTAESIKVVSK